MLRRPRRGLARWRHDHSNALLAALALVALSTTGCAVAGHSEEAYQLGDELRELPRRRATPTSHYVEPELFDSADVNLA